MGIFFVLCCFFVAFLPSLFIFRRFVAPDPLRIILFVLGAFFWLCSLLLSAVVFALFGHRLLLLAVFCSVLFQEVARSLYFLLLYKAQSGLARLMAADEGRTGTVASMRLLYSSRHILAIVCGLGMGTAAALFQLANVLAAHWDDGVVGFPGAVMASDNDTAAAAAATSAPTDQIATAETLNDHCAFSFHGISGCTAADGQQFLLFTDAFFPLYYSLGSALLTLFNIMWTVCGWDALHRCCYKIGTPTAWIGTALFTLFSHSANTTLSLFVRSSPLYVLVLQASLLLITSTHAFFLIKPRESGIIVARGI